VARVRRVKRVDGKAVPLHLWEAPGKTAPIIDMREAQEKITLHTIPFDVNYPSGLAGMTNDEAYAYLLRAV
jgi:hypothetical protein